MARKRMIDPNLWQSQDYKNLSHFARLIWIGLFSLADDEGRGVANSSYIKSMLFSYDDEKVKTKAVDKALDEIAQHMSIVFYRQGENEFYQLLNWQKWQKVEKPTQSKIPSPSACEKYRVMVGEKSGNVRGTVAPNRIRIEKNVIEQEENTTACACAREGEITFYSEVSGLAKQHCPVIYKRTQALIDMGRTSLIAEIDGLLAELAMPLAEYEKLFLHAGKTYLEKPGMKSITVAWLLKNIPKVYAAEQETISGSAASCGQKNDIYDILDEVLSERLNDSM